MKLSQRKLIKRLIIASIAATTLTWCSGGDVAHADADFESPDNPSNNTIEVNANSYTLNGTTINYSGWFGRSYGNSLGSILGGRGMSSDVIGNTLTFNGGNIRGQSIYGGFTSGGNVLNNTLNFNGGNFSVAVIAGGDIVGRISYGNVTGNTVNIGSGATFSGSYYSFAPTVAGGSIIFGNAEANTVNINGGTFSRVVGGYTTEGNAKNNTINITGGTFNNDKNIVAILAGAGTSEVSGNMINIWGSPNLSSATLYGYNAGAGTHYGIYAFNAGTHSGNTLNLATQITAQNIYAFDNINFFIPASMNSGGTMLTLTSTEGTDLRGTAIRAAMQGGSNLDTGDSVTLIQSAGTITTDSSTTYGKMTQAEYDAIKDRLPSGMLSDGVSLNYDMTIEKSGDNAIVARIGNTTDETATEATSNDSTDSSSSNGSTDSSSSSSSSSSNTSSNAASNSSGSSSSNGSSGSSSRPSGKLLPQTTVIANSAVMPTLHLAGYMSDKLIDWLPSRSFDFDDDTEDDSANLPDTPVKASSGYEFFIGAGGGSFRNKTGNGSYINSTVKGFDAGFGRIINYDSGDLAFAPVFEYATGDYDSYLSDGTHGKGSTKYVAGGLIGRKTFKSGFYIEASARGGKTERDFSSSTMTSGGSPVFVHYSKTSAPIFNGHLRIGRQLRLNRNNLIDIYGIYFHAHQGSMNLSLSTGEDYHFSSANARKIRLGYRLTTRTSKISRIYTGLAFQYEHNSDAVGTYKGRRTPGGSDHGASGMLEFGWLIKPNKNNSWMLDLNATGFIGHQRGLSGTIKLQKEF